MLIELSRQFYFVIHRLITTMLGRCCGSGRSSLFWVQANESLLLLHTNAPTDLVNRRALYYFVGVSQWYGADKLSVLIVASS